MDFAVNKINKSLKKEMEKNEKTAKENEETIKTINSKIASLTSQVAHLTNYRWREYDGTANNLNHPEWGSNNIALARKASPAYKDGVSTLAERGASNPNPRVVSNLVCKQEESVPSSLGLSDMVWVWGQFIDHTIDLTNGGSETANFPTLGVSEDPNEDYPDRTISFTRSASVIPEQSPRQQPNIIPAYVDGSCVYGNTGERAHALRKLDGSGKMKNTMGGVDDAEVLLPLNTVGLDNASPHASDPADFFLAGDIRANENIMLTALHTLFVREHNRLCDLIVTESPELVGQEEVIYQTARRMVGALLQTITYNEYLPALLGDSLPSYTGYRNDVNSSIFTEFSTVGYRLGHSMLSTDLSDGKGGTVFLQDAFFGPDYVKSNGIDNLLAGASSKEMQEIDIHIVEDVRSFLFGPPSAMNLLDLAALNIQRGRDHGIPGYNAVRSAYGLTSKTSFGEVNDTGKVTSDTVLAGKLESLYDTVDDIDPWVGALAEDRESGKAVGELLRVILVDQFVRIRDGDRYWFENDAAFSDSEKMAIGETRLSDVVKRNTGLSGVEDDLFHV